MPRSHFVTLLHSDCAFLGWGRGFKQAGVVRGTHHLRLLSYSLQDVQLHLVNSETSLMRHQAL